MQRQILLHKPLGLSSQQAINLFRDLNPEYQKITLGSAGRLDPMAEGLLVLMVGEENKNQDHYTNQDKTYEVEFLLGLTTDSYDLLGLPNPSIFDSKSIESSQVHAILKSYVGQITQPYPPYSAVRVGGKPLYWWARQNKLDEISIPVADRIIYAIDLFEIKSLKISDLKLEITQRISLVSGDFRQTEILQAWDHLLNNVAAEHIVNIKMRVECSTGTFMRGLVSQIGQDLGCGAVTRSIVRTKVGPWELSDAQKLNF